MHDDISLSACTHVRNTRFVSVRHPKARSEAKPQSVQFRNWPSQLTNEGEILLFGSAQLGLDWTGIPPTAGTFLSDGCLTLFASILWRHSSCTTTSAHHLLNAWSLAASRSNDCDARVCLFRFHTVFARLPAGLKQAAQSSISRSGPLNENSVFCRSADCTAMSFQVRIWGPGVEIADLHLRWQWS